jgi:hypothetical protein
MTMMAPKIVHDREGDDEYLQRGRDAAAEDGEDADGEGNVGGHRNAKAGLRWRAGVEQVVNRCRGHHAADGGDQRQ